MESRFERNNIGGALGVPDDPSVPSEPGFPGGHPGGGLGHAPQRPDPEPLAASSRSEEEEAFPELFLSFVDSDSAQIVDLHSLLFSLLTVARFSRRLRHFSHDNFTKCLIVV